METQDYQILLVEDDHDDIELLNEALSESGINLKNLKYAITLDSGLQYLTDGNIDLVILDLTLPDSRGLNTFIAVRNKAPLIPIIVLSGYDDKALAIEAVQSGAQDYLVKGKFNNELLARTIRYSIERQRLIVQLQKQSEALQLSESRLCNIINNITDGIIIVDQQRIIRFMNPSAKLLLGNNSNHIPAKLFEFPLVLGEITEIEIAVKDTQKIIAEMSVAEVEWEGKPAFLASLRDITKRKYGEEMLKILSRALEQTADHIIITNKNGIIEYVNPAFEKVTGYKKSEVIGKTPRILKSGKYDKSFYTMFWNRIQSGKAFFGEMINKKKDGEIYFEEKTVSPIKDESGNITHFVSTDKDISERKIAQAEKDRLQNQLYQAQKMEAIGRLAGGTAHDLNNIFSIIQGNSELALNKLKSDKNVDHNLKEILNSTVRGSKLTHQLLLFSRKQLPNIVPINLNNIINEMLRMLNRVIGEDIQIITKLEKKLWNVMADASNMEQVIMNLVVNARDAMPDGGKIKIETNNVHIDDEYCKMIEYAKTGNYIYCSVQDDGCGMDAETIKQIFEPFFTTKDKKTGTGLGLSVVYGIIKQHEGWINVYSELNHGSIFKIYLPASFVKVKNMKERVSSRMDLKGKKERILVIEDEPSIREMINEILTENGYISYTAIDGEHALKIFKEEKGGFDLILSDVIMPGINGVQLVKKLLKINPRINVLFSSGYSEEKSQLTVIHKEGYPLIQKPYNIYDLLKKIRELLDDN
jgi:two-component system cell cycle sensor histidine kinase/response regulator CckA